MQVARRIVPHRVVFRRWDDVDTASRLAVGRKWWDDVFVTERVGRRLDYVAVGAGAITVGMTVGYVALIRSQGHRPAWWVLAILEIAAVSTLYGSIRGARFRQAAVATGGTILAVLGVLGIFSIGLPLLLAAGLAFSALRSGAAQAA